MKAQLGLAALLALLLASSVAPERSAIADEPLLTKDDVEGFVKSLPGRARRMTAFGPCAGVGGALAPSSGDFGAPLTFGLGLRLFRPEPDPAALKDRILERAKGRLKDELVEIARTRALPTGEDLQQLKRDVIRDSVAEVRAELRARHRLQKPILAVDLEGGYVVGFGAGQARLSLGVGLGPVTIGPTFALSFEDGVGAVLGPELGLHLLPSAGPRSPVVSPFVRYDFALNGRDERDDVIMVGVRLMLDVI